MRASPGPSTRTWPPVNAAISELVVPTLFIHGTRDTFIPVESTRAAVQRLKGNVELLEIEGAQHGIAVFDAPQYLDPQTQAWQADVVRAICDWVQRPSAD